MSKKHKTTVKPVELPKADIEEVKIVEDKPSFDKAFQIVLGFEGGLSDNKFDKGGITKYGISLRFLESAGIDTNDLDKDGITLEPVGDINNDGTVDAEDIRLLTVENAKALYEQYFWKAVKADQIKEQHLATHLFDIAVNSGVKTAVILAQKALRNIGINIEIDGVIGNKTLKALNGSLLRTINNNIVYARINHYETIIRKDPTQSIFRTGWLRRANKFLLT